MENKQHAGDTHGPFFNGFVWGAIIGGIVVFLLSSKKGKKLLRVLTEQGLESVSELEELFEEAGDSYEAPLTKEQAKTVITEEKSVHTNGHRKESVAQKVARPARRLFRGIRRKS